jgi:membrane protein DedA with SNARE-associated domain
MLIRPHEIDRAHAWFERYGEAAVFVGRLLPVIRTFISLPAGVARMSFWRFSIYTLLGCLPWTFALAWVGYLLGTRWEQVERVMRPFAWAIAVAVVAATIWWVWHRVRRLRAETADDDAPKREPTSTPG